MSGTLQEMTPRAWAVVVLGFLLGATLFHVGADKATAAWWNLSASVLVNISISLLMARHHTPEKVG